MAAATPCQIGGSATASNELASRLGPQRPHGLPVLNLSTNVQKLTTKNFVAGENMATCMAYHASFKTVLCITVKPLETVKFQHNLKNKLYIPCEVYQHFSLIHLMNIKS
jgi:hypothetical protein